MYITKLCLVFANRSREATISRRIISTPIPPALYCRRNATRGRKVSILRELYPDSDILMYTSGIALLNPIHYVKIAISKSILWQKQCIATCMSVVSSFRISRILSTISRSERSAACRTEAKIAHPFHPWKKGNDVLPSAYVLRLTAHHLD